MSIIIFAILFLSLVVAVLADFLGDGLKQWLFRTGFSKEVLGVIVVVLVVLIVILVWLELKRDSPGPEPTPPIPSTLTVPASSTAVPTVTPMSKVNEIARDDFGSPSSGWDTISETNGASGYDNGKYFVDLNRRVLFLTLWEDGGPEVDNAVLEIDILGPLNRPGAAQGLGFGWQKDWKGTTYAFTVDSAGRCRVRESVEKGGWRTVLEGEPLQLDPDAPYHILRAEIRNSYMRGFVDGHLCIEAALPSYQRGFVGLVAMPNTETNRDRFLFDEFRIFEAP